MSLREVAKSRCAIVGISLTNMKTKAFVHRQRVILRTGISGFFVFNFVITGTPVSDFVSQFLNFDFSGAVNKRWLKISSTKFSSLQLRLVQTSYWQKIRNSNLP